MGDKWLIVLLAGVSYFCGHMAGLAKPGDEWLWEEFLNDVHESFNSTVGFLITWGLLLLVVRLFKGAGDYFRRKKEWDKEREKQ